MLHRTTIPRFQESENHTRMNHLVMNESVILPVAVDDQSCR